MRTITVKGTGNTRRGQNRYPATLLVPHPGDNAQCRPKHVLAVSSGFVEMINNRVKLFCLTAESPEEIDIRRAQEAKERAEEQMRQKQSIQEYHMNQLALSRAMARLRVTSHKEI